ncbi:hypothetical protein [Streptomyces sp. NPDC056045]|uniref:hypothetical protein n=1 Tax=Streptomyces sp. NPDC056045 TaxID=3345691 RepID=UPI0035DD61B7
MGEQANRLSDMEREPTLLSRHFVTLLTEFDQSVEQLERLAPTRSRHAENASAAYR